MKTALRIVAVILAVAGGANVALAQSSPGHGVVTGSQANEEENYGYPAYSPRTYMWHSHRHHWHHTHSR